MQRLDFNRLKYDLPSDLLELATQIEALNGLITRFKFSYNASAIVVDREFMQNSQEIYSTWDALTYTQLSLIRRRITMLSSLVTQGSIERFPKLLTFRTESKSFAPNSAAADSLDDELSIYLNELTIDLAAEKKKTDEVISSKSSAFIKENVSYALSVMQSFIFRNYNSLNSAKQEWYASLNITPPEKRNEDKQRINNALDWYMRGLNEVSAQALGLVFAPINKEEKTLLYLFGNIKLAYEQDTLDLEVPCKKKLLDPLYKDLRTALKIAEDAEMLKKLNVGPKLAPKLVSSESYQHQSLRDFNLVSKVIERQINLRCLQEIYYLHDRNPMKNIKSSIPQQELMQLYAVPSGAEIEQLYAIWLVNILSSVGLAVKNPTKDEERSMMLSSK